MRKQTIQYSSSMDVLIEIGKPLCLLERQHDMASEEFFYRYNQGKLPDDAECVEWANNYLHLHREPNAKF